MKNKRFILLLVIVVILLLIPFIAMQFTNEVDWGIFDFTMMGILLLGAVSICELFLRKVKSIRNRILFCGVVVFVFFLIWAELAIGMFGTFLAGS